jgi:hypothetical protein
MAMTDFGLTGNALVNVMAEANGADDKDLAHRYVSSAFYAVLLITAVLSGVLLATFTRIPWRIVFRVSDNLSTQKLYLACALALTMFVLAFPLNMLNSL